MIKKTLYFGNGCYLSKQDNQLKLEYPEEDKPDRTVPIEDIGIVVLDSQRITITQALISALMENNAAIVGCDSTRKPQGIMLPMYSHHAYVEKLNYQLDASLPLKKNLWQQTIKAKIRNQGMLLYNMKVDAEKMGYYMRQVNSGDPENIEGRAAAYYWGKMFETLELTVNRGRYEDPPNNLLNYGYAILRAVIARSLVGSGMLPAIGIHHRNKYNAYCLADDIMEPYRPYVDDLVWQIATDTEDLEELTPELKKRLLVIPALDVVIDGQNSPLMIAAQRTTASLMQCFERNNRKMLYPKMQAEE